MLLPGRFDQLRGAAPLDRRRRARGRASPESGLGARLALGVASVSSERARFWARLGDLETTHLPDSIRSALGRIWAETAQMEHASIASFNRFSLQLLAVGAPPELLEGSQRAGLDEIEHARMAFALASKYGAESVGPGALDLRGDTLGSLDLPSVAAGTVEEGCVGETLAALEAEAARDGALELVVRAAWSVIAEDEARHAELAWSFVRWALDQGQPAVRAAVKEAFERAFQRLPPRRSWSRRSTRSSKRTDACRRAPAGRSTNAPSRACSAQPWTNSSSGAISA